MYTDEQNKEILNRFSDARLLPSAIVKWTKSYSEQISRLDASVKNLSTNLGLYNNTPATRAFNAGAISELFYSVIKSHNMIGEMLEELKNAVGVEYQELEGEIKQLVGFMNIESEDK